MIYEINPPPSQSQSRNNWGIDRGLSHVECDAARAPADICTLCGTVLEGLCQAYFSRLLAMEYSVEWSPAFSWNGNRMGIANPFDKSQHSCFWYKTIRSFVRGKRLPQVRRKMRNACDKG